MFINTGKSYLTAREIEGCWQKNNVNLSCKNSASFIKLFYEYGNESFTLKGMKVLAFILFIDNF